MDTAAKIDRKTEELRAATRTANEALADLKAERKLLERDVNEARRHLKDEMHEFLEGIAVRELAQLSEQVARARDAALDKTMRSMDDYWALLIGAEPGLPHGDILPLLKGRLERIDERLAELEDRRR